MGATTFSGPIRSGSSRYGATSNVGFTTLSQSGTVVYGANGTSTVIGYIPAGSQIIDVYVDVTTAFNAGTTNTVKIGDGTTANKFADALDVSSAARVLASSDVSQLGNLANTGTADIPLTVTYNRSGSAPSAGAARVTVLYVQGNNLS